MIPNPQIKKYADEFSSIRDSFLGHRTEQRNNVQFYRQNAFYPRKANDRRKQRVGANLLRALVDKNVSYLSKPHTVKVTPPGMDEISRAVAGLNEKIVLSVYDENGLDYLHSLWAFCVTVMKEAFCLTDFNVRMRKVRLRWLDPRFCYYQFSEENSQEDINVFYYAVPMTAQQVEAKFGIRADQLVADGMDEMLEEAEPVDDTDRYFVIHRWDATTRCAWVGNQWVEPPHRHGWDCLPIDRVTANYDGDPDRRGASFLEPLIPLQAEFNETLRRKINVIKRMGNPPVWARGLLGNQLNDVKQSLKGEGGFVSLKRDGELGLLQLKETGLFDQHLSSLFDYMKHISGFPNATFGEAVGANTSADALNMYFQPTAKALEQQWIGFKRFYRSINAKILKGYELFGLAGEQFQLFGNNPKGTLEIAGYDEQGAPQYQPSGRGFSVQFTPQMISGYHRTEIMPPESTPKNEIEYKRLIMDAANSGFIPRITGFDEWGFNSPEDQLDLLVQEQSNPALNPAAANVAPGPQPGDAGAPPSPASPAAAPVPAGA